MADGDIYGADIINLYDEDRSMDKYDSYVFERYGYNPGAKQWESRSFWIGGHKFNRTILRESHAEEDWGFDITGDGDLDDSVDFTDGQKLINPDGDMDDSYSVGWFGHCDCWSAASIMEPEPFMTAINCSGIYFAVGDQKGLLSKLHCNDWIGMWGTPYEGPGDDPDDIYPCDFHNVLINRTGLKRKPVVMDINRLEPVSNYPAYRYAMNIQPDPNNPSRKLVTCTVWFVDDDVLPDFVGTQVFTKIYTYNVTLDTNGYAVNDPNTCAWVDSSRTDHPDGIWYPKVQQAETGCPLDYDIVKEICWVPAAAILVVDDDRGKWYEMYYKDALDAGGYRYDCCLPSPDASVLLQYPVVVWFTGDDWTNTLSETDEANLQTYLDSGGNLFISGQDIGVDIRNDPFYTDYLHADYEMDNTGIHTLNGVPDDPIGEGLTIGISEGDGADNQDWPSEIAPYDGDASAVFNYAGDGCGAIKADTGTYKVVYFAFGFEAIDNAADRNTVMDRLMMWLMTTNYTFYLRTGQNYHSMPVLPPEGERNPDDIFGRDVEVWRYITETEWWERVDVVACKEGYYVYNPWMPKTINVTGMPCDVSVTDLIAIYNGLPVGQWALVGPGNRNISVAGTVLDDRIDGYNYNTGEFESVTLLEAGNGYWMGKQYEALWTRYSSRIDTETQYLGVGGIASDSEDNVIIVSNRDIIKYDTNGALLWEYDMCGGGIAVDKTDNSVVVGLCNSSIIKFDKTGNIVWLKETNEPVNCVDSVSINSNGDILVAGMREDSWELYWEIMDKNGNYLYSITRSHAGWYPAPTGTFGNAGNVFIARGSAVEKLTADLHSLWHITIPNCDMEIISLGVDSYNNLFAHGQTRIGGSGSNSYTGKYNGANGDLIWERIYDSGYMDGAGFSTSLTVDSADNVFVMGTTDYKTGDKGKASILAIKYNGSDGEVLKHILYRKSSIDKLFEVGCGIARDSNGYIYIGGKEYDISNGEGCGIETRRALTIKCNINNGEKNKFPHTATRHNIFSSDRSKDHFPHPETV